jgi:hypothetical protein
MRRLSGFILLLALAFALPAFSQQRWQRAYGGGNADCGESVQQTSDGGYIVAGFSTSFGNGTQVYLVKTNASGDTLWSKTYGGTGTDWGRSVQQTSDGGYIIAGWTTSFGAGMEDVYLIKTNNQGNTLWTKTYGGTNGDWGSSVQQTSDGGYIIAGYTESFGAGNRDVYLIKTNSQGDTLWTKTYGGTGLDGGSSIQQTSDGGYIIAGSTHSFGAGRYDVYLIKTNASGDTLWTRTYGGTNDDFSQSIWQTSDGGYIVSGFTLSFGAGGYDVYLIKTNASGNMLWTRTYGGVSTDWGWSIQQTTDGGYIIGGNTDSFGDSSQVYLVRTNASGDTLWTRTYGGAGNEAGYSVQQTSDGGYIVAGYTSSFGAGYDDVYLIKTDAYGNVGVESPIRKVDGSASRPLQVTPNPFSSFATLPGHSSDRFTLYDVSGRRVGVYRGDRIGEGLKAGVYFLRAESGDGKPVRIVKVK